MVILKKRLRKIHYIFISISIFIFFDAYFNENSLISHIFPSSRSKFPIFNSPASNSATILENSKGEIEDSYVLVGAGFETCFSFLFLKSCTNNINQIFDIFPNDREFLEKAQISYIKKNLYAKKRYFSTIYAYEVRLPYDIVKEETIPAIDDFYVFNKKENENNHNDFSKKIPNGILIESNNEKTFSGLKKLGYFNAGYGLWYHVSTKYKKSYSHINYLFGPKADIPIPGWFQPSLYPLSINPKDELSAGSDRPIKDVKEIDYHQFDYEVYLFVKHRVTAKLPSVNLKANKKLKIVQLADLHLSTGFGECLDFVPEDYSTKKCLADELTLSFVNKVLNLENPDLVILSGDQIFGEASFDSETSMYKVLKPLIERKIPYAMVFGNHDDEGSLNRAELMDLTNSSNLPYSLSSKGPEDVDGFGNYEIVFKGNDNNKKLIIYMLDSHSYSPTKSFRYDWFKESQKDYVKALESSHKNSLNALRMAFFHIPMIEYRDIYQLDPEQYQGKRLETIVSPNINTHMFDVLKDVGN